MHIEVCERTCTAVEVRGQLQEFVLSYDLGNRELNSSGWAWQEVPWLLSGRFLFCFFLPLYTTNIFFHSGFFYTLHGVFITDREIYNFNLRQLIIISPSLRMNAADPVWARFPVLKLLKTLFDN